MPSRLLKLAPLSAALTGVAWLAVAVSPASAQHRFFRHNDPCQPCPPAPCAPAPLYSR